MKLGFDWPSRTLLTKDNGKQTTTPEHWYTISSRCEPDGSGKLKNLCNHEENLFDTKGLM